MTAHAALRRRTVVRALAAVLTLWALATIVPDLTRPFAPLGTIGLTVDFDGRVRAVTPGGPAGAAGIVALSARGPGDRLDFERTSRDVLFQLYGGLGGRAFFLPGRVVPLALIGPGGTRRSRTLVAAPRETTPLERANLVLGGLLGIGFVALGAFLVWQLPLRRDVFGFFLFAIWFNPGQDYVFYQVLPAALRVPQELLAALLQGAGLAGFALFALRFPTGESEGWRRPVERCLPALVVVLAALALAGSGAAFGRPSRGLWLATFWAQVALYPLIVAAFLAKLRELPREEHERLRWVIFGCIPGLFFFLLAESVDVTSLWQPLFERTHWAPPDILIDGAYLVNALVPICIGYAVLRRRVLPIDFIVNRGLTLGIVWALVAMFAEAAVLATHRFIEEHHVASALVIAVAVTLVAPLLERLKEAVNDVLDRVLFVRLHAARLALERSGESLAAQTSAAPIESALVEEPCEQLELTCAALFALAGDGSYRLGAAHRWPPAASRSFGPEHALVRKLRRSLREERSRGALRERGGEAAEPGEPDLVVTLAPNYYIEAFVLYGAHANGSRLTPDEAQVVTRFVRDCGSARAHAQALALRAELARLNAGRQAAGRES